MRVNLERAMRYPYEHIVPCVLIPGVMIYVDILLMLVLVVIVVVIVVLVGGASGFDPHDLSFGGQLPSGLPPFAEEGLRRLDQVARLAHQGQWQQMGSALGLPDLMAGDPVGGSGGSSSGGSHHSSPGDGISDLSGEEGPLFSLFWFGFAWNLYGHWKANGLESPPPSFSFRYFLEGFKGLAFYLPVNLLLVLSVILVIGTYFVIIMAVNNLSDPKMVFTLLGAEMIASIIGLGLLLLGMWLGTFFLSPFLIAPMMHSCETRRLRDLYNIPAALRITMEHYTDILLAFLMIGLVTVVYGVGLFVFVIVTCCLGVLLLPFFHGAFKITAALLLAQAYGLLDDHSAEAERLPVTAL